MSLRSPLSRARGLGSAKDGVSHWVWQRLTALALVPLTFWFVASVALHVDADYAVMRAWVATPYVAVLLSLYLATLFHHSQLGLQVVIEDYVHTRWVNLSLLLLVKFSHVLLAAAGIFAVLKIALGSSA
ncbi:MAG: succinate dehydrogenase, hydrophobic membrane anchor protein [Nevskiales bacterium]